MQFSSVEFVRFCSVAAVSAAQFVGLRGSCLQENNSVSAERSQFVSLEKSFNPEQLS